MKKQQRADWIAQHLATLYPDPPIPLDHHDPFTLLIAVLLRSVHGQDGKFGDTQFVEIGGQPRGHESTQRG